MRDIFILNIKRPHEVTTKTSFEIVNVVFNYFSEFNLQLPRTFKSKLSLWLNISLAFR